MIAIDNSNLINYCRNCNCSGFTPVLTYAYNAGAKTVTVTSASTVSSPDGWKIGRIAVHDQFGGTAFGHIDTVNGNVVVSTASLNASKPYSVTATIITNGGCTADGSASQIGAAGSLGGWDKKFSEASAQTPLDPAPEPNPIDVDKTALQAKLNAVALLDEDAYTAPTWTAFVTSKTAALAVINDEDATQEDVDDALADLIAKQTALVAA
ncbi:hypothetical protein F0919_17880 [Taibaiella lutea]|uniref:Uncharacterized protein n=1 Tax=Taibaiella lutea TaxID=2608001 RepID=A0A5M6CC70_9BACT|nr:FIVAR domain-containing protein [Taibaiella lutea]KAA5532651.1 hypothetical protein F0919_17880 [Taibaiella lutea]